MLRNHSWVIEGQLCGLALPGRLSPIDEDYATLRQAGVTLVVTAMVTPAPFEALEASGLEGMHVAIRDFAPATSHQLDTFVTRAKAEIAGGGAVAVHCFAGMGRTGMLLAAYLAATDRQGGDAAIEKIRSLRPGSIETSEQEDAVRTYARSIR